MVDSSATYNFIFKQEARWLELNVKKDSGKMKIVYFEALPIVGTVKKASLKLGGWRGDVDLVLIRMDDFDVVLVIEFLLEYIVIPVPLL